MNIRNKKVELLAQRLADITGESQTTAILRALEERLHRLARNGSERRLRVEQVLDFLENEIWPKVPRKMLGRPISKRERERIVG